ncbi:MAG TPA: hypothetical protein PKM43_18525 [Verrucomicrobiota bacterium]|nr:hypothetical protein [Verrucomicrobiota bacterium]HRZ35296.1 hypothetical protein [Candidatus Paceibacterota bacterium]
MSKCNSEVFVGTAQLDITPERGIDLAGFAVRPQPATAVLDPLHARALYLEHGSEQLLWIQADILGFDQALADRLRAWGQVELGIPAPRIWLTATHTHSGPATIALTGCGALQPAYVARLEDRICHAARLARDTTEPCRLIESHGQCRLGIDRRGFASAHTDPHVAAFAWQRSDGTIKAALLDYAMHPVCLRGSWISADWPGETARVISDSLPGHPVTIVGSGACGNINPPQVGVAPEQMRDWGASVAHSVLPGLLRDSRMPPASGDGAFRVLTARIDLPLDHWSSGELDAHKASCLADLSGSQAFGYKFRLALEAWHDMMSRRLQRGEPPTTRLELGALALGQSAILTVNAEVFSKFTALADPGVVPHIATVGCTNGMIGYLPTTDACDEGGYEVKWAMLFYNLPRPRRGGLELAARTARKLLGSIF